MSHLRETTFDVAGMTCMSCARHVDQALRDLEGVTDVRVSVREGKAVVADDGRSPIEVMIAALREAGYEAAPAVPG
jgi:copper chaperone CopZ